MTEQVSSKTMDYSDLYLVEYLFESNSSLM